MTGGGDPAEHEAGEPVPNQGLEEVGGVHGGQGGSHRTGRESKERKGSRWEIKKLMTNFEKMGNVGEGGATLAAQTGKKRKDLDLAPCERRVM